jgi:hypothetical protein
MYRCLIFYPCASDFNQHKRINFLLQRLLITVHSKDNFLAGWFTKKLSNLVQKNWNHLVCNILYCLLDLQQWVDVMLAFKRLWNSVWWVSKSAAVLLEKWQNVHITLVQTRLNSWPLLWFGYTIYFMWLSSGI